MKTIMCIPCAMVKHTFDNPSNLRWKGRCCNPYKP